MYKRIATLNGLKEKKSDCKPFMSDIKLHIKASNSFVYPDTMVVYGGFKTADTNSHNPENPAIK